MTKKKQQCSAKFKAEAVNPVETYLKIFNQVT